jgi:carbamoyl-phosphate synthase large subunit
MLSVGYRIPEKNILMSTGTMRDKVELLEPARLLIEKGYKIFGTRGTAKFLVENGVEATPLAWPDEDQHPNVLDYLKNKQIDMVVNIPKNLSKNELNNDYTIRRSAVDFNIPLITNARLASAFLTAICKNSLEDIKIKSWDEY